MTASFHEIWSKLGIQISIQVTIFSVKTPSCAKIAQKYNDGFVMVTQNVVDGIIF